jgi:hypothetical protein
MAGPVSPSNTRAQSLDAVIASDGTPKLKLAVGDVDGGLDNDLAWQGVATHVDGGAVGANDGVVVTAGVDESDGVTPRHNIADEAGKVIVRPDPKIGAFTDISGTITAGGTAQTISAASLTRRYLLIQNVDPDEDMWVDFGVDAVEDQPSIRLAPYGSIVFENSFVPSQAVSVIATTTAHPFTAKEA